MKTIRRVIAFLSLALVLAGCANGVLSGGLYSHTVKPLTINPNPTEVRSSMQQAFGHINQFQYSVVSVRVGKNGIGQVAKENGLETIYFADIESWSVAFGIWQRNVVHIYGR